MVSRFHPALVSVLIMAYRTYGKRHSLTMKVLNIWLASVAVSRVYEDFSHSNDGLV